MRKPTNNIQTKSCGFRCSWWDALVIIVAGMLAFLLYHYDIEVWWIVPAVTGHFFLFCNVFLVWRRLELIWAGFFVTIVVWCMMEGELGWRPAMFYVCPVTLTVILLQLKSPWYHGVGARRLNPRLDEFLKDKLA